MVAPQLPAPIIRGVQKASFLKGRLKLLFAWPLGCGLVAAMLWSATNARLASDLQAAEAAALQNAASLSRSYAEQLSRAVQQIDQITMSVKYYWERSGGAIVLEEQRRQGIYPNSSLLYVNVFDAAGQLKTTTIDNAAPLNVSNRPYFQLHRSTPGVLGLLISEPFVGRMKGRTIVTFTRTLLDHNGSFDGIASVSVEPEWLASYYDQGSLGSRDVLMVRDAGNKVLAATIGGAVTPDVGLFRKQPNLNGVNGVVRLPADHFLDDVPRYLAWQRLEGYPLTAMVGISATDALQMTESNAARYRNMVIAATLLLALLALVGIGYTVRLEWRRHQNEQTRALYGISGDGGSEAFYLATPIENRDQIVTDYQIVDCNQRGATLYGLERAQLNGRRLSTFYHGAQYAALLALLNTALRDGYHEDEYQVPDNSRARPRWFHRKFTRNERGVAIMLSDISRRKEHEAALSRMANSDALTGLPNRQWLNGYLPDALKQAQFKDNRLALLFLDLDDFKHVNDTHGHAAGDAVLRSVALRLRSMIRPSDNAVRIGGDEFTVILEGVGNDQDISVVAERISAALRAPHPLADGRELQVDASIGISVFPEDGDNAETLLGHADIAMYDTKTRGKANYRFFQPLSEALLEQRDHRQCLRDAVDRDEFVLQFQPQVDTGSGQLRALEALLRWRHPKRGLLAPEDFIPAAEESGLIVALGELVIRKVCAQIADWHRQDIDVPTVSINVSPRQIGRESLVATLVACMDAYKVPAAKLQIEISEAGLMDHAAATGQELGAIRALGIGLAVDDFGTGYASLLQLQQMAVGTIKIDRSLTAQIVHRHDTEAFFMAVISMAHVLDMQVVAKGVESDRQHHLLRVLACNQIQGFLVSRPLAAEEIPALVQEQRQFAMCPESVLNTG